MKKEHSKDLQEKIWKLLQPNQDAINFILAYGEMAELVDDLVDEVFSMERFRRYCTLKSAVYSSNYWLAHRDELYLVDQLINLTYFDSVVWEKSVEKWKLFDACCLSHTGYNMLFAVLMLEKGPEAAHSISLEFRESAHLQHIDDNEDLSTI